MKTNRIICHHPLDRTSPPKFHLSDPLRIGCPQGADLAEIWRAASLPLAEVDSVRLTLYEEDQEEAHAALIEHREHCHMCRNRQRPRSSMLSWVPRVLWLAARLFPAPRDFLPKDTLE